MNKKYTWKDFINLYRSTYTQNQVDKMLIKNVAEIEKRLETATPEDYLKFDASISPIEKVMREYDNI